LGFQDKMLTGVEF